MWNSLRGNARSQKTCVIAWRRILSGMSSGYAAPQPECAICRLMMRCRCTVRLLDSAAEHVLVQPRRIERIVPMRRVFIDVSNIMITATKHGHCVDPRLLVNALCGAHPKDRMECLFAGSGPKVCLLRESFIIRAYAYVTLRMCVCVFVWVMNPMSCAHRRIIDNARLPHSL